MTTSQQPLQVLIVEDSENDAALLELELQRAGYDTHCQRVETAEAMSSALQNRKWDLVIADYVMPHFNGLDALAVVRGVGLDLPFIIVSGHITDDTAVAAMKAGAHDYVMKDNLTRLGPAVQRELREAEVRRQRRKSEETLLAEYSFRQAVENSVPSGIAAVDLEGRQTYVNPAFCEMLGWKESDLVGARPPFIYWPPDEIDAITDGLASVIQGDAPSSGIELVFRRRTGERIHVLLQVTPLKDSFGNVSGWVSSASDITERKRAEVRLAAEHAITRILANAQSIEEAIPGILQVLLDSLEMDFGAFWALDPKRRLLHPSVTNLRTSSPGLKTFVEESRRLSFASGVNLPGRVWKERRALWITDLVEEPAFDQRKLASEAGLRSAVAFPIQSAAELFGVLEFFSLHRMEPDQTLLNMMTAIASEIGQFIQRRSAEENLRRAHDELELRVQQRTADLKTANTRLELAINERKRLEHELLEITEKERRRIGLDLHDDLGQKLSGVALMIKGLELRLAKQKASEAQEAAKIHILVQQAMSHASDLAHDLATLDVKENNLTLALNDLAARVKELFEISCRFKAQGSIPPLEPNVVGQLYKIAQEAVTNAIKHGKAKKVGISLSNGSDHIVLTVQNDGKPFPDMKSRSTGMGLRIMNYRASLIGASLEIKGTGPNGTLVTCSLPLEGKKVARNPEPAHLSNAIPGPS
jgi:PAS domain S-box-containing protein